MTYPVEAVDRAVREALASPHRGFDVGQAAIDALTALGWLPPESVERLLKHQHDIIGAQVASLEKADLEIERLSAAHAAIERAALERAASKAASILEEDRKYSSSSVTIVGSIPREILALAPSNSTWREVKEGYVVVPRDGALKLLNVLNNGCNAQMYADPDDTELLDASNELESMLKTGDKP